MAPHGPLARSRCPGTRPPTIAALNDDRLASPWTNSSAATAVPLALTVPLTRSRNSSRVGRTANDSTTLTFSGDYADAAQESRRQGQPRLAITWGHNKDHRPDLKQLLFILTVSKDGESGLLPGQERNVADDTNHRDTWDLLCKLAGRVDFLYVANCKFASTENMGYVHGHGGRFLTVCPAPGLRTASSAPPWPAAGSVGDAFTISTTRRETHRSLPRQRTGDDECRRLSPGVVSRGQGGAGRLGPAGNWSGPGRIWRSSSRSSRRRGPATASAKVTEAVEAILQARGTTPWVVVTIDEHEQEVFHQERPGRPNPQTKYRRR